MRASRNSPQNSSVSEISKRNSELEFPIQNSQFPIPNPIQNSKLEIPNWEQSFQESQCLIIIAAHVSDSTVVTSASAASADGGTSSISILAAPNPTSFVEIIQLIQSGGKPTDIRTDIDDSAQANVIASISMLPQRPKVQPRRL